MRLVLINGPAGIGKSTITQMIHTAIPLSLHLDIDAQRRYINEYRTHRTESHDLVMNLAFAMTNSYLSNGQSVIIDKVITDPQITEKFIEIAEQYAVEVSEFVLNASKETLVKRAAERGYRDGSLLTPQKVEEIWEGIQTYLKERPDALVLDTENLSIGETYECIREKLSL